MTKSEKEMTVTLPEWQLRLMMDCLNAATAMCHEQMDNRKNLGSIREEWRDKEEEIAKTFTNLDKQWRVQERK